MRGLALKGKPKSNAHFTNNSADTAKTSTLHMKFRGKARAVLYYTSILHYNKNLYRFLDWTTILTV